MNRRTVLRSAGVVAVASLAGCVDAVEEHFTGGLESPVPVEITNEGERSYNISLDATARGQDRQTYEESYTITPGERVAPPHINGSEQQFRVIRHGDGDEIENLVETGTITEETSLVLITITDDAVDLEIIEDDEEAEREREAVEGDSNETNGSAGDNATQG
ncbi:hypothetical protein [Natronococcus sp. JC468]|uniref:hypothetical protein n=1 Tax=Natronococcus sp. JC468 TaxID=1961921 RepID=UPI0028A8940E|nr:hypothetical protein [Natronococcus sp. JC468]